MIATQSVDPSVSRTPLPLDAADRPTICVLCSQNCGVRVDVAGGRIVAVRADERNPITTGYICNKGFSIPSYVRHAERLAHPLKRRPDGGFERIGWDVAIAEIAARLADIRARHSPRAIGLVGIGGQGNHMDAPYGLGFLRALGSRRWFNAFAQEKTQHCLMDQWMFDASPATYLHADQRNARFLLVLGTNPRISNRGHNATETFKGFVEDPRHTLVVVDPRETETTRGAHRHLRVRPGTDAYLLLGLAATIVRRGLVDEAFVAEKTRDFARLAEALAAVDVEEMARRCGLEPAAIVETATAFAEAESAAVFYDLGVEQTPFSTLISYLIRVLLSLTGNVGRPGGNVFFETILVPEPWRPREPERALASGIPAIAALGNFAMFSPTLVPEEVLLDHPERLRALIVEGSNPFLSYSDTARWREARERLELLVVIEPAMTETARAADYVLPTPVGYEKWEFANFPKGYPEIFVQVRPPVVPGPTEALPEPEIYARLAEAMGIFGDAPAALHDLAAGALEPEGAMRFLGAAQELTATDGIAKERLLFWTYRALGPHLRSPALAAIWLQCQLNAMLRLPSVLRTLGPDWQARSPFEVAAELFRRILDHPEGVEIARIAEDTNLEDHLGFEDGRIRLAPEPMLGEIGRAVASPPAHDASFPFVLAAGLRTRWTANTIQRDPAWRKGRGPHCALNLSPADARDLGVRDGDRVRVATRRGAVTLPAQIDPKLLPGHVWMPNGFGMVHDGMLDGANQNELTDTADRDPFTGIPHHRHVRCRLERFSGGAAGA
ncbi:MAG: molybdopterin oxidoreductase family protein [Deltaproteobacteria bacterium]|nr:MAG: molybdopterin oxidoreductase family protein [Deltaproteobacteria bacterium]